MALPQVEKKRARKTAESKTPVHSCEYCDKSFTRESTMVTHMCVKKKRHMDANTPGSRLAFMAYDLFYKMSPNYREKTIREFIDSSLYMGFARFGNYLTGLKPLFPEQFVRFLVKNGTRLDDWTEESVYYVYLNDLLKREPASSAVERTFETIFQWTEEKSVPFGEFFIKISPNELSHLVRMGRVSPWVLYLSSTGGSAMAAFNEDHMGMIGDTIDAAQWSRVFRERSDDVAFVSGLLQEAGI